MMLALSVSSIGDRQGHGGCLGVGVTLSMCGVSPTFVRRLADFVRRLADFVRRLADFVRRLADFVRRLADFVRRLADFVRRLADFVRRLADFVRRLADFQNHAGPRLTLLRLRGGVQGRRPRLRL